MTINTLCKSFNKCAYITRGQALTPTQYSVFIRPKNALNGYNLNEYGQAFKYDIGAFERVPQITIPQSFKKIIELESEKRKNESVLLYAFYHYDTNHKDKKIVHGFVLTDRNHNLIAIRYMNNRKKSMNVVDTCVNIVTV